MNESVVIQGRCIGPEEIALIQRLLAGHGDWHRTRLSRELCQAWAWRNAAGQLKDMACRTLLLKLEAHGFIRLPARRGPSVNAARYRGVPVVEHAREEMGGSLQDLLPLAIRPVGNEAEPLALFKSLIAQYHYLGVRSAAGENLKYLVRDRYGRLLCCLWFAAAAWRCKARDQFIGWDENARTRHLPWLANNTRFLVLPWVRVPQLASQVLSDIARRVSADWQGKYGHALYALETFVDRERFTGACYRAANWWKVGQTTGRTRNDRVNRGPLSSLKDIYLYPLVRDFRRALCAPPAGSPPRP